LFVHTDEVIEWSDTGESARPCFADARHKNYNDSLRVTVRFAKMVGEVLTMGSARGAEKQPFKFYV
jgi:hypothetical protein